MPKVMVDRKTALEVFGYGLYWDTYCYQIAPEHHETIGQNFFVKSCALFMTSIGATAEEFETVLKALFEKSLKDAAMVEDANGEHNARYLLTQVLPDFTRQLNEILTNFNYDFSPESVTLTH